MCGFNPFCPDQEGKCECLVKMQRPIMHLNPSLILKNLVIQQSTLQSILESLQSISSNIDFLTSPSSQNHFELSSPSQILSAISTNSQYQYSLKPLVHISDIQYKDRNFSLKFEIVDDKDSQVVLPDKEKFILGIFTADYPPNELIINTSGDKVLKGNCEIYASHIVEFSKICICEVSSHFRNSVFYLVIKSENDSLVQPLVIPNLMVKARKKPNKAKKHQKFE